MQLTAYSIRSFVASAYGSSLTPSVRLLRGRQNPVLSLEQWFVETIQSTIELQKEQKGKLLHILGVGFGIAGAIGATIGAGILRTPGSVAARLGNSTFIIAAWIVGGVYALLSAISVSELAASMPQAGGWYVYARRAFGDYAGFIVGWMDWLCHCAVLAWLIICSVNHVKENINPLCAGARLRSRASSR